MPNAPTFAMATLTFPCDGDGCYYHEDGTPIVY